MNRLLITLFGILSTAAVLILLLLLYRYANQNDERIYANTFEKEYFQHRERPIKKERKWLEDLAAKKKPSYTYAVSEMEIDLPLKKRPEPQRAFRLILSHLDNYKMFCIRQLLEQHGVEFSIFRKKDNGVLVIHDLDKNRLDRIVKLVREFDITIETENYIKD